jgi:hypothetical protein
LRTACNDAHAIVVAEDAAINHRLMAWIASIQQIVDTMGGDYVPGDIRKCCIELQEHLGLRPINFGVDNNSSVYFRGGSDDDTLLSNNN